MYQHVRNGEGRGWSPVFVRVALGLVFLVAGVGKVFAVGPKATGIAGFAGFLASLGVPMPTLFAWLVGLLELTGGALLLLGLFTRYAAVLLAIDMLVATLLVHLPSGFAVGNGGYEYTLVLALVSISLVFSGPGRLALEYAVFDREFLPGNSRRSDSAEEVRA
ncbi:DoxX family protein [Halalkalicoccus jeotgali]|uniref:DoxX family protein n=1 Tax=Halalkalicoccus jeotgali (strain DSM 18796 / CECT 7217 / JCM 14584 / KCTC 4019 / B3) TaxID=795797 RepID=D8J745_HALJB|nr:DoxX family protein [Halalkalicoccus jeotgali]ADJ15998.1 DoxX family protein [Halalkalicoccus jeotgali B3]ELY38094.1 DoxX family protein [Halalkalicoccus jeotgali B3]